MRLLRSYLFRDFLKKKRFQPSLVFKKEFLAKGSTFPKRLKTKYKTSRGYRTKKKGMKNSLKSNVPEFSVLKRGFSTFYRKVGKYNKYRQLKSAGDRFSKFKKKVGTMFFIKKVRRKKVRRNSNIVVWQEKKGALTILQRVLLLNRLNNFLRTRFFLPRFFFKFLRKPLFLYKFGFVSNRFEVCFFEAFSEEAPA